MSRSVLRAQRAGQARPGKQRRLPRRWLVLGLALLVVAPVLGWAISAYATTDANELTLVVNNRRWVEPSRVTAANRLACETNALDAPQITTGSATGTTGCPLIAAVQAANAAGPEYARVNIVVSATIGQTRSASDSLMTGWPSGAAAANRMRMNTTQHSFQSNGILFHITRDNVTINLDDRLWPDSSARDRGEHTLFHVGTPNPPTVNGRLQAAGGNGVELLNINRALSSGTSFVVGAGVRDTLISGDAPYSDGTRCGVVSDGQDPDDEYYEYDPDRITSGLRECFSQARTANWGPERFVLIQEGARNVTVDGFSLSGFYDRQGHVGLFMFTSGRAISDATWIDGVTISNIDVVNPAGTGRCSSGNGSGCRARLTNFVGTSAFNADRLAIRNLTFDSLFVQGMNENTTSAAGGTGALNRVSQILDFTTGWNGTSAASGAPLIENLIIQNSVFANNGGQPQLHRAVIALPPGDRLRGTTIIRDNLFSTLTAGRAAININAGNATANSTAQSPIVIYNNHFDGFSHAAGAVHAWRTGLVTVERNTFSRGGGAATVVAEESNGGTAGGNMFRNRDNTANQNVRTWTPIGTATVATGLGGLEGELNEETQWITEDGVSYDGPRCDVNVDILPEISPHPSGSPAVVRTYVDVFWTRNNRAELFVGRYDVTDNPGTVMLNVPLPVGQVALPGHEGLPGWVQPIPDTIATISDPITGELNGNLRMQTHFYRGGGTPDDTNTMRFQSSQFSRTVPLTGNCAPSLTIHRAAHQVDTTMSRYLTFTVESSTPLAPGSINRTEIIDGQLIFTAFDGALTATHTDLTIDTDWVAPGVQDGIDAHVVAVFETPGSDIENTSYDVVVRVSDSTLVTLELPAGRVQSTGGLHNLQPAAYQVTPGAPPIGQHNGNQVTFINPLEVSASHVTVITGQVIPGTDDSNPEWAWREFFVAKRTGGPSPTCPEPTEDLLAAHPCTPGTAVDVNFTTNVWSENYVDQLHDSPPFFTRNLPASDAIGDSPAASLPLQGSNHVIKPGQPDTGDIPFRVPTEDSVVSGTSAWIWSQATSADPLFDGLVTRPIRVTMFATNPFIEVRREAFIQVPDAGWSDTPTVDQAVIAAMRSGADFAGDSCDETNPVSCPVPSGQRLESGTPICFVWTVQNVSPDPVSEGQIGGFVPYLRNVAVWDTDTEFGYMGRIANGVIRDGGVLLSAIDPDTGDGLVLETGMYGPGVCEYARVGQCTHIRTCDTRVAGTCTTN